MKLHRLVIIILWIALPLFLLLLSYQVILFIVPLTPEQELTMSFLREGEQLQMNYTAQEISHLEDVQKVMDYTNYFFYIVTLLIFSLLIKHYKHKEEVKVVLKQGGIATMAAMAFILIVSLLFFNEMFTLFHLLFFPQGNWIFAADSLLIQTFPVTFFIRISIGIFILTFGEGALLLGMALRWKK